MNETDDRGAQDTERPDAMVFVKNFIFGRDDAVYHVFREFLERDESSFFIGVNFIEKVGTGAVVDFGALGDLPVLETIRVREVATDENDRHDTGQKAENTESDCGF